MERQSLGRQFKLWTILLVVVPSMLIMTIYTVFQVRAAKQHNLELISQRVSFQVQIIEAWFAQRLTDVRDISQSEAFRTMGEERMQQALNMAQQANPNFDSLSGSLGGKRVYFQDGCRPEQRLGDNQRFCAGL